MRIRRFLERLAKGSASERADIVRALVRVYREVELPEAQLHDIEATLIVVLDDPAVAVRKALAEALATVPRAPRSLVRALIADVPPVALPLLSSSSLVSEAELLTLVDGMDDLARRAVASRPEVGLPLAAALAEVGDAPCCLALISNPGASVAASSFRRIVERHRDDPELRSALLERDDLPPLLRRMLIDGLSEVLGQSPFVLACLSPERSRLLVAELRDDAAATLAGVSEAHALRQHVAALHEEGRLDTALLLRTAALGRPEPVVEMLAVLAGVPARRVRAVLGGGGSHALGALWRRAGLPRYALPAFARLVAAGGAADAATLDDALDLLEEATEEGAERLRQLLRRLARDAARAAARDHTGGYFRAA